MRECEERGRVGCESGAVDAPSPPARPSRAAASAETRDVAGVLTPTPASGAHAEGGALRGWCSALGAGGRRARAPRVAGAALAVAVLVAAQVLVRRAPGGPGALESDAEFSRPQHAQQPRRATNFMDFADKPVEPFQTRAHASRVSALPWYTSASQQDEKWGGVHESSAFPNAAQNAYLRAQHVAQSHTGQLLRWRNYVTQRRSDATPQEQLAQARGMANVASAEYNQARAQLAAMKKLAVIRRLSTKRREAKQLTSDVDSFASGMLRNEDLAQVKQDEAYGKIAQATKILNRMAHSGLLRRRAAAERMHRLQQLPYVVTHVAPNARASTPNVRGFVSNGYQHLPAYGGPAVSDCGPAGSSMAADTVCNGVTTAMAATMLGARLQVMSRVLSFRHVAHQQHVAHPLVACPKKRKH